MADNPLYPGYIPDPKKDPGGIYPGYYPGTPQQPKRYQANITPNQFNIDEILSHIDYVSADFDRMGPGFPNWVAERLIDDWKQSMKASITNKGVKQEDLDDYDPDSLPGAFGIDVSLNPADWAKDPGKMAKKTVEGWVRKGANWNDLETKFRQQTWRRVFQEESNAPDLITQAATTALGMNIAAQAGMSYAPSSNPLQLKNRNIYDDRRGGKERELGMSITVDAAGNVTGNKSNYKTSQRGVDVMSDFANSLGQFEVASGFGPKRDDARDDTAYKGFRAIVTELEQNPAAQALIKTDKAMEQALSSGKAHLEVYENMTSVGKEMNAYREKVLDKAVLKRKSLDEVINKSSSTYLTELRTKVEGNLKKIDDTIADLQSKGMTKEAAYLQKYAAPFKKQTQDILKLDALDPTKIKAINPRSALNQLGAHMDGGMNGRPLAKGSTFSPSMPRTLLRSMETDVTRPGMRGGTIGSLIKRTAEVDKTIASQAVMGGLTWVRNTGDISGAMDVLNAVEKGQVLERYIWPKMKVYWQASTPAEYTKRALKRVNHFGLIVSDEDKFEKSLIYKSTTMFKDKTSIEPGKFYGNWFTVEKNFRGDKVLDGVRVGGRLYGGSQFAVVSDMHSLIKTNGWEKMNTAAFAHFMTIVDENKGAAQSVNDALKNLDPNSAFFKKLVFLNGGVNPMLPTSISDNEVSEFLTNIHKFKKWAKANKNKLNINIDEDDDRFYLALFLALKSHDLNPDNLSITRKYVGSLEKVFSKLNTLQTKVYNSWLGKVIAPTVLLKKGLSDLISAGVAKILALIAAGASSGVLAPVMAAIEPIIRFLVQVTVDKVTEFAGVFYKAIVHADIDGVFKYIDKTTERFTKIFIIITGTIAMLFIIPADNFMGTMATAFSPVDNTMVAGVGDNFASGLHLGPGVKLEPFSTTPSSVGGCFDFDNYHGETFPILGQNLVLQEWPTVWKEAFEKYGIQALEERSGGYLARLCDESKGRISLVWAEAKHEGGFCGITTSAGNALTGKDTIFFGYNLWCYRTPIGVAQPDWWYTYIFAHETGHVYDNRWGYETFNGLTFGGTTGNGEGTLRTYPGHCRSDLGQGEDYAENIANWIQINNYDCGVQAGSAEEFWAQYPKHREYAEQVLFRP